MLARAWWNFSGGFPSVSARHRPRSRGSNNSVGFFRFAPTAKRSGRTAVTGSNWKATSANTPKRISATEFAPVAMTRSSARYSGIPTRKPPSSFCRKTKDPESVQRENSTCFRNEPAEVPFLRASRRGGRTQENAVFPPINRPPPRQVRSRNQALSSRPSTGVRIWRVRPRPSPARVAALETELYPPSAARSRKPEPAQRERPPQETRCEARSPIRPPLPSAATAASELAGRDRPARSDYGQRARLLPAI